jgi:hypothetical protein
MNPITGMRQHTERGAQVLRLEIAAERVRKEDDFPMFGPRTGLFPAGTKQLVEHGLVGQLTIPKPVPPPARQAAPRREADPTLAQTGQAW